MALEPCPGCEETARVSSSSTTTNYESSGPVYTPGPENVFDSLADAQQEQITEQAGATDYVVTWDPADTSKEKLGLGIAGGLAFLAPFVALSVAAKVAHNDKGYFRPVGYGAITFFAMRAAAVGVLHFTDNLPTVTAPAALGAVLPQMPHRRPVPQGRVYRSSATGQAPCRGCR